MGNVVIDGFALINYILICLSNHAIHVQLLNGILSTWFAHPTISARPIYVFSTVPILVKSAMSLSWFVY